MVSLRTTSAWWFARIEILSSHIHTFARSAFCSARAPRLQRLVVKGQVFVAAMLCAEEPTEEQQQDCAAAKAQPARSLAQSLAASGPGISIHFRIPHQAHRHSVSLSASAVLPCIAHQLSIQQQVRQTRSCSASWLLRHKEWRKKRAERLQIR